MATGHRDLLGFCVTWATVSYQKLDPWPILYFLCFSVKKNLKEFPVLILPKEESCAFCQEAVTGPITGRFGEGAGMGEKHQAHSVLGLSCF